ncbi:MAG TPA: hypothetical protein DEQ28_01080 [Clostridiales bacterium]|nr:hypothetical protein [Clostridiales bacterium]
MHRLAANVRVWEGGGPYGEEYYLWDYWFVDADPVTIEIRFAEAIPDLAGAILQIREALAGAVIHEEGYEADRVFVRATLPPGRNFVMLWDIRLADAPTIEPPGVILDRGRPFRLMYWLPGGTPEVLGDYILPKLPFRAAPVAEREKAVFGTVVFGPGEAHIAKTSLWHWQPDAQPPLSPLPGEWYGRAREMVFPRGDDLVIKRANSVVVADWSGQLIATLVEDREQMGTAVGPEGEIAVFTRRRDDQGGLILDLTIFSANLG